MSRLLLPIVVVAVLALTGCAGEKLAQPIGETTAPSVTAPSAALGLVNLWRVTGADGAGDDAFLRLDGTDLTAWTDCGIASGSWRATDTAFLADVSGATGGPECLGDRLAGVPATSLEWLYDSRSFRPAASDGFELLGADGSVVAALVVDGAPPSNPNLSDDYTRAPEVTPDVEARFVAPAPLPDGAAPVDGSAAMIGRWEPDGEYSAERPFVEFAADGSWSGSDGCNGGGGRWALGEQGALLATSGPSTLIACDGAFVPYWVAGAARAGLVDGTLTFFDPAGAELGAVARL